MNGLISSGTPAQHPVQESLLSSLSHLDSKTLVIVSGMFCLATVVCVGFVSLSGSEMTLTKNGLSITQPHVAS